MRQMSQILEDLDGLLRQEINAYQHLVTLQREEQRLVVAQVLEAFLDNLHAKEHLAGTLARLEQQRLNLLSELASVLDLPVASLTLEQVSTRVEPPYASQFLNHRAVLQGLLHEVQQLNRANAQLLGGALTFIQGALAVFAPAQPAHLTYLPSGRRPAQIAGTYLSGRV